jgi:hypothetical protein
VRSTRDNRGVRRLLSHAVGLARCNTEVALANTATKFLLSRQWRDYCCQRRMSAHLSLSRRQGRRRRRRDGPVQVCLEGGLGMADEQMQLHLVRVPSFSESDRRGRCRHEIRAPKRVDSAPAITWDWTWPASTARLTSTASLPAATRPRRPHHGLAGRPTAKPDSEAPLHCVRPRAGLAGRIAGAATRRPAIRPGPACARPLPARPAQPA